MANLTDNRTGRVTESRQGGFGLSLQLFLAFAGLILVAQGAAIVVTMLRGNAVAEREVNGALSHGLLVQEALERERFRQLELIADRFAADPYFTGYVAEALQSMLDFGGDVDTASVADLLRERQQEQGFDFAMLLDDRGDVMARTDGPASGLASLADDPVAGPVIETLEADTGYWKRRDGVYQVSVVPLANGYELIGFLVTGLRIGDAFVGEITRISGAELAIFARQADGWQMTASTLEAAADRQLAEWLSRGVEAGVRSDIEIDRHDWRLAVRRLGSNDMLAVTLTDRALALEGYRSILTVLWISVAAAVALALLLGGVMSRSLAKPIRQFADAAAFAAHGDYRQALPDTGHSGRELRQLAVAFSRLLADLREKAEMEQFLSDLARLQPEPGEPAAGFSAGTETLAGCLLGICWRGDTDMQQLQERTDAMVRASAPYRAQLLQAGGNRLMFTVPGHDPAVAVAAAGGMLEALAKTGTDASVAILGTNVQRGELIAAGMRVEAWVAAKSDQLQQLLADSVLGKVLLPKSLGENLQRAGLDVAVCRGALTSRNFYAVDAAVATSLAIADDDRTMALTQLAAVSSEVSAGAGLRPGMIFGQRFEILSELGRGGMGVVFKARDRELKESVALKVLLNDAEFSDADIENMKSEIRFARRITHPNILRTHDFGIFHGVPFISMEYVRGLTLKYLLRQSSRLPASAALRIARQTCNALAAAHAQNVLHRDIKPENIIVEPNGNSKLMDFGIARAARDADGEVQIMGTPRYAAPEQLLGEALNETVDIYAFGVMLFEMFTGRLPYRTGKLETLIQLKQAGLPEDAFIEFPDVPEAVRKIVRACLAGNPSERPRTAQELLYCLDQLQA